MVRRTEGEGDREARDLCQPALTLTHPYPDRRRPITHDFAGGNCKNRG
jgi:hypothetical protein